ncbi:hypothetical protein [Cohnella herbarum]|uniref:Uncharacterized protein n=1 Tax=Cohnella herbarum TaxID=2728023 RepID=A0A7Z2VPB3_9BACL|nr:hypothetical protein [Cohnella herbarum]QJD86698.1 hypothetical protein HH215_28345 [Cohnella herbarum]
MTFRSSGLTTLRIDFGAMLEKVTASLIEHIEQRTTEYTSFVVDMKLVKRDSCKQV